MSHTNTFSLFFTVAVCLFVIAFFNPQVIGQGSDISPSYQNTGQIPLFGQQCPHGSQRDKCSLCKTIGDTMLKSFDGGAGVGREMRLSVYLPKWKITAGGKAGVVLAALAALAAVLIATNANVQTFGIAAVIVAVLFFLGIVYGFGTEDTEETVSENVQPSDDPPSDSPLIEGLPLEFGDG